MPAFLTSIGASVLAALGTAGPVTAGAATAAGIGTAAAAAGAGYGIYAAGAGAAKEELKQPETLLAAPTIPTLAPAPTAENAEDKAKAEIEKQRRMRALAGGKTILTSEGPVLSSGGGKTLLGS
jgi:hypothetical protein